jgi:hypothetical protein
LTTFALVGGRGREIFLPLGARTVETAGRKERNRKKIVHLESKVLLGLPIQARDGRVPGLRRSIKRHGRQEKKRKIEGSGGSGKD